MTARIIPFRPRAPFDVVLQREGPAWLVTVRGHGWLHGSRTDALHDARWLSKKFGVPIKEVAR
jgi:hypothetical protein